MDGGQGSAGPGWSCAVAGWRPNKNPHRSRGFWQEGGSGLEVKALLELGYVITHRHLEHRRNLRIHQGIE